jgi:hypothetical protein
METVKRAAALLDPSAESPWTDSPGGGQTSAWLVEIHNRRSVAAVEREKAHVEA